MKQTPLHEIHIAAGAKLAPFAGYEMPIRYSGDKDEHFCVRQKVGVFDVSHMGEFLFKGPKALPFLQAVTSNDVSKLPLSKAQYSCLPNKTGGIVDDIIVYHLEDEVYMMVVNASNMEKDWNWLVAENGAFGADMTDLSDKTALIAVSGPLAAKTLNKICSVDLSKLEYYQTTRCTFAGEENVLIATTGYTGEWTYEIFCKNESAVHFWKEIFKAGEEFGIQPTGLGARDTLRLEMGYMLYGNDINDTCSPIEAGLSWITKTNKGAFNSSETFAAQKQNGVAKKLVAFEMIEKGIPRHDYPIVWQGKTIGVVTSGSQSPTLEKGIGMGYVSPEFAELGSEIEISIRDKAVKAKVVKAPFVTNTSLAKK